MADRSGHLESTIRFKGPSYFDEHILCNYLTKRSAIMYQALLVPPGEGSDTGGELRTRYFLSPAQLRDLQPRLMQVRSQVATERELNQVPAELQPLDAGFIDLPQKTLDHIAARARPARSAGA